MNEVKFLEFFVQVLSVDSYFQSRDDIEVAFRSKELRIYTQMYFDGANRTVEKHS